MNASPKHLSLTSKQSTKTCMNRSENRDIPAEFDMAAQASMWFIPQQKAAYFTKAFPPFNLQITMSLAF
jgi:hypothetical protein